MLSAASLFTVSKYIFAQLTWIISIRNQPAFSNAWTQLGAYEKLKFINMWNVFTVIGNLFQLFGAVLTLFEHNIVLAVLDALIGLGCFCAWIGSMRFLNHTSKEYMMVNTLDRSITTIGPYIVGAVPIFMAYVFFAICTFWETGLYPNAYMGMIAAFAVVNGDSVFAFGDAEYSQSNILGMAFYFTFVVFFIW